MINSEILANIHHPRTKTRSSSRFRSETPNEGVSEGNESLDVFCIEIWIAHIILFHHFNTIDGRIVFIEIDQAFQKGIDISHELLSCIPTQIFRNFASRRCQYHTSRYDLKKRSFCIDEDNFVHLDNFGSRTSKRF